MTWKWPLDFAFSHAIDWSTISEQLSGDILMSELDEKERLAQLAMLEAEAAPGMGPFESRSHAIRYAILNTFGLHGRPE